MHCNYVAPFFAIATDISGDLPHGCEYLFSTPETSCVASPCRRASPCHRAAPSRSLVRSAVIRIHPCSSSSEQLNDRAALLSSFLLHWSVRLGPDHWAILSRTSLPFLIWVRNDWVIVLTPSPPGRALSRGPAALFTARRSRNEHRVFLQPSEHLWRRRCALHHWQCCAAPVLTLTPLLSLGHKDEHAAWFCAEAKHSGAACSCWS